MFKLFATVSLLAASSLASNNDSDLMLSFNDFIFKFNKVYSNQVEFNNAFENFAANSALASKNPTNGITQFSDLSAEEFKATFLTLKPRSVESIASTPKYNGECFACTRFPSHANVMDDTFDWIPLGAVVEVKDQGQCGSCWAFATVGGIEGTHFLAGNTLTSLSEQQIVSCDVTPDTQGCSGGWMDAAMNYVISTGGIVSETAYPYTAGSGIAGTCATAKVKDFSASITGWTQISSTSAGEADMYTALPKTGPIVIAIDATPMQMYRSGIDNPSSCGTTIDQINHAVLVVGYGVEGGVNYWKIKNSWGTSWGEKGYYRIVRGVDKCALASDALVSTITKSSLRGETASPIIFSALS